MNEWYLIKKLIYLITVVAVVILYTSLNQPDYQKISFYYPSKLLQRLSKSLEFIIIEPIPFEIKDSQLLGFTVFENRSHFITERLGAAEEFHFIYENDPRLFSVSYANTKNLGRFEISNDTKF